MIYKHSKANQVSVICTKVSPNVLQIPISNQTLDIFINQIEAPYSTRKEDQLMIFVCKSVGVCVAAWSGIVFGVSGTQTPNLVSIVSDQIYVSQLASVSITFSPYGFYIPPTSVSITIPVYFANQCMIYYLYVVDSLKFEGIQNFNTSQFKLYKNTVIFADAITSYLDIRNGDQVALSIKGLRNPQVSSQSASFGIQTYDPDNNIQDS